MTNLEFINQQIIKLEDDLQHYTMVEVDKAKQFFIKEEIKQLKQIKIKLEAWEVVKHVIYKRKMEEKHYIQIMGSVYNKGEYWTSDINPYEKLEKALEVEDE